MGATDFINFGVGSDAKEAFSTLVSSAKYENGHGGYTGTIAEKSSFVMITPPSTVDVSDKRQVRDYIDTLLDDDESSISDKWGPAGCIKTAEGYYFFGWAAE